MADGIPTTFNSRSTAAEVTEGVDLKGKVIIVTGTQAGENA